jgi:hypothetical protein
MIESRIGLTDEQIDALSETARQLYNNIFDYCTYASDPQYQTLHKFRMRIHALPVSDRDALIAYFNADPAITWTDMPSAPYEYYATPY